MVNKIYVLTVGERFGRLTILNSFIKGKYRYGVYLCDCGTETTKNVSHVKNGLTTSCGCYKKEMSGEKNRTHGMTKTSEFTSWQSMINRCYNKNNNKYNNYGGRGITVCAKWKNSFQAFFADMGKKPTKKHSIDRFPDNNGNYEPQNCRWGTTKQQAGNTRRNHWIEHDGERKILQDWADYLGGTQSNIWKMLKKKTFAGVYNYYINKKNCSRAS